MSSTSMTLLEAAQNEVERLKSECRALKEDKAQKKDKIRCYQRKYYHGKSHELHKQKRREYYYRNREWMTRKVDCPHCGRKISHISRSSHWKSKRCKREAAARSDAEPAQDGGDERH